jgi:hypothetical protein
MSLSRRCLPHRLRQRQRILGLTSDKDVFAFTTTGGSVSRRRAEGGRE